MKGEEGEEELTKTNKFPWSIYFIMGNEFCERFSYYGMRAILALYLNQYLLLSEGQATGGVHLFTAAAYTTTLFGAYISDSYLGRYRTILYISLVYLLGSVLMSITAVEGLMGNPPSVWGSVLALSLIAVGTGGIKPCVSSFVGDQIPPHETELLASAFSLFYFFINTGSVLSTFVTPLLRENFGYAVAFGVPALLLAAAVLVFFLGRNTYRQMPPGPNVFGTMATVIAAAFANWNRARPPWRQWCAEQWHSCWLARQFNRCRAFFQRRFYASAASGLMAENEEQDEDDHHAFLDYALESCDPQQVADVKATLSAFMIFIPMPVYWSIYDQSSSRWIFQAAHMDLCLAGSNDNGACNWGLEVQPDQVPVLNPLLVIALIPIFVKYVYPFFTRLLGGTLHPLRHKMVWGMYLNSVAIICAAVLQAFVSARPGRVSIYWQLPQWIIVSAGEIMVSITGLEFSFAVAPKSMKSLVMAGWLLTTALGNLIVAFVAESDFIANVSLQMLFFAYLMLAFILLFQQVINVFDRSVQLYSE